MQYMQEAYYPPISPPASSSLTYQLNLTIAHDIIIHCSLGLHWGKIIVCKGFSTGKHAVGETDYFPRDTVQSWLSRLKSPGWRRKKQVFRKHWRWKNIGSSFFVSIINLSLFMMRMKVPVGLASLGIGDQCLQARRPRCCAPLMAQMPGLIKLIAKKNQSFSLTKKPH